MPRRAVRCIAELNLHRVSAPGCWLPSREDCYLSVSLFSQFKNSQLLGSVFPIDIKESFRFEKTYFTALDVEEVIELLEDELVVIELLQLSEYSDGAIHLATYTNNVRDFIYPYETYKPTFLSRDRDIFLERTVAFPGISPKLEFSSKVNLKESYSEELDALEDAVDYHKKTIKDIRRSKRRSRSCSPSQRNRKAKSKLTSSTSRSWRERRAVDTNTMYGDYREVPNRQVVDDFEVDYESYPRTSAAKGRSFDDYRQFTKSRDRTRTLQGEGPGGVDYEDYGSFTDRRPEGMRPYPVDDIDLDVYRRQIARNKSSSRRPYPKDGIYFDVSKPSNRSHNAGEMNIGTQAIPRSSYLDAAGRPYKRSPYAAGYMDTNTPQRQPVAMDCLDNDIDINHRQGRPFGISDPADDMDIDNRQARPFRRSYPADDMDIDNRQARPFRRSYPADDMDIDNRQARPFRRSDPTDMDSEISYDFRNNDHTGGKGHLQGKTGPHARSKHNLPSQRFYPRDDLDIDQRKPRSANLPSYPYDDLDIHLPPKSRLGGRKVYPADDMDLYLNRLPPGKNHLHGYTGPFETDSDIGEYSRIKPRKNGNLGLKTRPKPKTVSHVPTIGQRSASPFRRTLDGPISTNRSKPPTVPYSSPRRIFRKPKTLQASIVQQRPNSPKRSNLRQRPISPRTQKMNRPISPRTQRLNRPISPKSTSLSRRPYSPVRSVLYQRPDSPGRTHPLSLKPRSVSTDDRIRPLSPKRTPQRLIHRPGSPQRVVLPQTQRLASPPRYPYLRRSQEPMTYSRPVSASVLPLYASNLPSQSKSPLRLSSQIPMRDVIMPENSSSLPPRPTVVNHKLGGFPSGYGKPLDYAYLYRAPSPTLSQRIEDINLYAYADNRPPFVVRKLDDDLIGRQPGGLLEMNAKSKPHKCIRLNKNRSKIATVSFEGYNDLDAYTNIKRNYGRPKISPPSSFRSSPTPLYRSTYLSDDDDLDDDSEIAGITSKVRGYNVPLRARSVSPGRGRRQRSLSPHSKRVTSPIGDRNSRRDIYINPHLKSSRLSRPGRNTSLRLGRDASPTIKDGPYSYYGRDVSPKVGRDDISNLKKLGKKRGAKKPTDMADFSNRPNRQKLKTKHPKNTAKSSPLNDKYKPPLDLDDSPFQDYENGSDNDSLLDRHYDLDRNRNRNARIDRDTHSKVADMTDQVGARHRELQTDGNIKPRSRLDDHKGPSTKKNNVDPRIHYRKDPQYRTDRIDPLNKLDSDRRGAGRQDSERSPPSRFQDNSVDPDRLLGVQLDPRQNRGRIEPGRLDTDRMHEDRPRQVKLGQDGLFADGLYPDGLADNRLDPERLDGDTHLYPDRLRTDSFGPDRRHNNNIYPDKLESDNLGQGRLGNNNLEPDTLKEDRLGLERLYFNISYPERLDGDISGFDRLAGDRLDLDKRRDDKLDQRKLGGNRLNPGRLQGDRPNQGKVGGDTLRHGDISGIGEPSLRQYPLRSGQRPVQDELYPSSRPGRDSGYKSFPADNINLFTQYDTPIDRFKNVDIPQTDNLNVDLSRKYEDYPRRSEYDRSRVGGLDRDTTSNIERVSRRDKFDREKRQKVQGLDDNHVTRSKYVVETDDIGPRRDYTKLCGEGIDEVDYYHASHMTGDNNKGNYSLDNVTNEIGHDGLNGNLLFRNQRTSSSNKSHASLLNGVDAGISSKWATKSDMFSPRTSRADAYWEQVLLDGMTTKGPLPSRPVSPVLNKARFRDRFSDSPFFSTSSNLSERAVERSHRYRYPTHDTMDELALDTSLAQYRRYNPKYLY